MKKLLTVFFALFVALSFSLSAFAQDNAATDLKVKVEFHCANGKALLESKLAEVPGIKSFVVDLETKIIDFKYDAAIITREGIIAEIEKIGYYTEFSDKSKEIKKACSHGENHEGHNHE
jgi:copper chaperone CopZ